MLGQIWSARKRLSQRGEGVASHHAIQMSKEVIGGVAPCRSVVRHPCKMDGCFQAGTRKKPVVGIVGLTADAATGCREMDGNSCTRKADLTGAKELFTPT